MFGGCFMIVLATAAARARSTPTDTPMPTPTSTTTSEPTTTARTADTRPAQAAHKCSRTDVDVQVACHMMVEKRLKAPSTAEWPGMFSGDHATLNADCSVTYSSWVEASNAYGVKIRTNYTCRYDPKTDEISLDMD